MRVTWSLSNPSTSLLLFGFLTLFHGAHGSSLVRTLQKNLNHEASPCTQLYDHVCNFGNKKMREFLRESEYALLFDLSKRVSYTDEDIQLILKALHKENEKSAKERKACRLAGVKESKSRGAQATGETLGQLFAMGVEPENSPGRFVCSKERCDLIPKGGRYVYKRQQLKDVDNPLVKGLAVGYLSKLGTSVDQNMDISYYDVPRNFFELRGIKAFSEKGDWSALPQRIFKPEHDQCSDEKCKEQFKNIAQLAVLAPFAPFFNAMFATLMFEHQMELKPEVADEFLILMNKVKAKVASRINEGAHWMNSTQKAEVEKYLNNVELIVGIPESARDLGKLRELLGNYRKALRESPRDRCDLENIVRAIGLNRNRVRFFGKHPQLHPQMVSFNHEDSLFMRQATQKKTTIHFYPGFLHILNDEYPLGFKYGFAGWTGGHELFHGLGLLQFRERDMGGIATTAHFKSASECYIDYYGSFCMDEGCPDGKKKANEGFADVESARIVYSLLLEALRQRSGRQKRSIPANERLPLFDSPPIEELLSDSPLGGRSERKWFFKALSMIFCQLGPKDKKYEKDMMDTDVHPRGTIRGNAIAKQLAVYSKVFDCKPNDPNYVTKPVCSVYPFDINDDQMPPDEEEEKRDPNSAEASLPTAFALLVPLLARLMT